MGKTRAGQFIREKEGRLTKMGKTQAGQFIREKEGRLTKMGKSRAGQFIREKDGRLTKRSEGVTERRQGKGKTATRMGRILNEGPRQNN